jgi:eukaryotic-like serine/threonine-protein kinase
VRHPLLPILRVTCLLGSALALGALMLFRPKEEPAPVVDSEVDAVWATDVDPLGPVLTLVGPVATGPLPGQKRPPCTPVRERELAGGCWIGTEHRPPCPEAVYEVSGRCVLPVQAARRPDTSIGR